MTKQKQKRKPMVFPSQQKMTADEHEASQRGKEAYQVEPPEGGWDASYVPGFSDQKHLNQLRRLEGKQPIQLDANLCWLPLDPKHLMIYRKMGYEVITDAYTDDSGKRRSNMLEQHGYSVPEQARIQKDGTILKDDTVLGYVPGERYRKEVAKEAERRAFLEGKGPLETEESGKIAVKSDDIVWSE